MALVATGVCKGVKAVTISWAGACMHAWEVSKVCLRGLRRRPAIDCHCMVAAVTNGDEGKTKGWQPLNAPLRIKKERTTRESKRHGKVAEHTGGWPAACQDCDSA
jgi:hypothetical protein